MDAHTLKAVDRPVAATREQLLAEITALQADADQVQAEAAAAWRTSAISGADDLKARAAAYATRNFGTAWDVVSISVGLGPGKAPETLTVIADPPRAAAAG